MFRRLDYALWRATAHNPVRMLRDDPARARLEAAAADPEFLALYDRAIAALDDARAARNTWWTHTLSAPHAASRSRTSPPSSRCTSRCRSTPAASACSPATTARKRATSACRSIGVGFMYPQGYFHQHVSAEGWQEESYERLNWADAPIEPAMTPDGKPCITAVPLGDRSVLVAVWRVRIGRVKLYLLDTDLEENAPWDRELSARLYGGDRETRIQQEIILGIGGVRALKALGIEPGGLPPQRRPRRRSSSCSASAI